MKAIIIAGGTPPSLKLLKNEITTSSIIICADSGANCLLTYNIIPNYCIGDLDSINNAALEFLQQNKVIIEKASRHKDTTDAFLALHKAIQLGASEIIFLGCTGGTRLDHFFGSLGLLAHCLNKKITAAIKDECNTIVLLDQAATINGAMGQIFSVHAFCDCVTNLTLKNCKYELTDYALKIGDPLTLSNEFLDIPVIISLSSGTLMLITQNILCTDQ